MPRINGNEIRPGAILEHDGGLWAAVKVNHVKPGKGGAFAQVELKNLRDGRKLTNIDANPRVCINVVEIEEMAKRWRSVLAFGTARWIDDDEGMRAAIHVIRAQYPGPPARSGGTTDALRSQGFRVMKLVVDEMTGRAQE